MMVVAGIRHNDLPAMKAVNDLGQWWRYVGSG